MFAWDLVCDECECVLVRRCSLEISRDTGEDTELSEGGDCGILWLCMFVSVCVSTCECVYVTLALSSTPHRLTASQAAENKFNGKRALIDS